MNIHEYTVKMAQHDSKSHQGKEQKEGTGGGDGEKRERELSEVITKAVSEG